jgi:hypothetical protein
LLTHWKANSRFFADMWGKESVFTALWRNIGFFHPKNLRIHGKTDLFTICLRKQEWIAPSVVTAESVVRLWFDRVLS